MTIRTPICVLVVLIVSFGGWNLAQARSLAGQCSNWVVGSLTEIDGTNRVPEIKAVCTSIRESGDFIAEYESRSKTCMLCALDDWTPSSSSSTSASASANIPGIVEEEKSHPCGDSNIPISAEWTYYGRGGGGTWSDREKAGLICKGNGYATYSSSEMKYYTCDKGYVNCQLKKTVPIDNVVQKDNKTIYKYGRNSAVRTPTNQDTSSGVGETGTSTPEGNSIRAVHSQTIPDLVGYRAAEAETQLTDLGVTIQWRAGSTTKDPNLPGRVERQNPDAGTDLKTVGQVELWVYGIAENTGSNLNSSTRTPPQH